MTEFLVLITMLIIWVFVLKIIAINICKGIDYIVGKKWHRR